MKRVKLHRDHPGTAFWGLFLAILVASQAVGSVIQPPSMEIWTDVGYPLVYYRFAEGMGYAYFNLIFLMIDLAVVYVASWVVLHVYGRYGKEVLKRKR